ncbi:MAG: RNA methyltransferase [Gammaproteobacteria bacterium]|nr:RNA methyltransferase [Gammaproteobacteria bacterium]
MNNNIRIVLVNTSHPGNIGAVARAMKTMQLENLYLVNPKEFPNVNATAMAAGADDILAKATVTKSLQEALHDTKIVFGTSTRFRVLQLPPLNPKEAAKIITNEGKAHEVAIVFGRENNGLSNEELEMCNYQVYIPTDPIFSSLNLAAAVQLIAYEIKMTEQPNTSFNSSPIELASSDEIQYFYQHLQQTLLDVNFLYHKNQDLLMAKLKRMFNKTQLEKKEVSILRGILTAINTKTKSGLPRKTKNVSLAMTEKE